MELPCQRCKDVPIFDTPFLLLVEFRYEGLGMYQGSNIGSAMTMEVLYFKQLDPRAILPTRGSSSSAGLDIYSIEDLTIEPGQRTLARTGLSVAIPEGFYGRVAPRSGLAIKTGLDVLAGVIDSDYRGEILCALYNTGDARILLPARSKICQLIIEKIATPAAAWSDELSETARGAGGFGSTG